jgi:hypothetical protein
MGGRNQKAKVKGKRQKSALFYLTLYQMENLKKGNYAFLIFDFCLLPFAFSS